MSSVAVERIGQLVDGKPAASVDEARLVETLAALRATRPEPPAQLRERVRGLGNEPRSRRLGAFAWRRGLLVLAPACLAVALGGAVISGLVSSGRDATGPRSVQHGAAVAGASTTPGDARTWNESAAPNAKRPAPFPAQGKQAGAGRAASSAATGLPPSTSRLQAYDAYLRLRVRGVERLSNVTKQALAIARGLGGYPAYVNVNSAKQGDATLRLRVPVGHVQDAVSRLSQLGTILGQSYSVTDLERQSNQQLDAIARLQGRIGRLRITLADRSLAPERRTRLQLRLDRLQNTLRSTTARHGATITRGRLATVSLSFTTRSAAAPVTPHHDGRVGRALHDAAAVLARELAWVLYGLIVLAPLALLAGLVLLGARVFRRREERFVLERV